MIPDMFINPHALPSRMTIGHLIETVYGKAMALKPGSLPFDASGFQRIFDLLGNDDGPVQCVYRFIN